MNIEASQREMTERMANLLPTDKRQISLNVLPRREPFEIIYRLSCDNLCADFREDLQFRFSWGITALIQRFAGKKSHHIALSNYPQRPPATLLSPLDVEPPPLPSPPSSFTLLQPEDWSLTSRIALASIGSQGTMGTLLLTGFMLKTVGWRLILGFAGIYGCLYLYERVTWTNKAKERAFKKQYVDHATKKLRLIVDLTSANCSHQVQQELSSTFARLCHLVDEATQEMSVEMKTLDRQLRMLDEAANSAKVLRNKATYLNKELLIFDESYLNNQD